MSVMRRELDSLREAVILLINYGFGAKLGDPVGSETSTQDLCASLQLARTVLQDKSDRQYLDEVAAALHPHWPANSRAAYLPGQLADMIRELQAQNAAAPPRRPRGFLARLLSR